MYDEPKLMPPAYAAQLQCRTTYATAKSGLEQGRQIALLFY